MSAYDVIGIGNAIVDVIASAEDTFLNHMGIEKGIMQLIEKDRAEVLYAAMSDRTETPGGSVANTIAGIGALGLSTAFIGKVKDDALGQFYAKGMQDAGTAFPNAPDGGKILFLEGYLFDKDDGKTAFAEAAAQMKAAGGRTGITLSDPFCADRHRVDFLALITNSMDFAIGPMIWIRP